ncbi:MAG: hypothetical protein INR65_02510 [Gluconacetobacter diazotrophicus]|nr:hypothetical protein [Gluconacetobacter diazotrophicus]
MADWSQSSYLQAGGFGIADPATPPAQAFGLGNVGSYDGRVTVALVLNRANDPTALLDGNWAQRQAALKALNDAGTLDSTFGATQASYDVVTSFLGSHGIAVLSQDHYISSAAARTVWVSVTSDQFATLFGQGLQYGTVASTVGKLQAGTGVLFWDGTLTPNAAIADALMGLYTGAVVRPIADATDTAAVTLSNGPQGIGNAAASNRTLFPNAIAADYGFPLEGSAMKTPAIGLIEPGIGGAVPQGNIQDLVDAYRTSAGVTGTGRIGEGPVEIAPGTDSSGERSLDVGVVAAAAPNSDIQLYAGGGGVFSATEEAIRDPKRIGVLSSSFTESAHPAPGSPFYAAYQSLFEDAALRNISVFEPGGDGGSSGELATGRPTVGDIANSRWAVVVGGTSTSSLEQAQADPTLQGLAAQVLAGNRASLRNLVAGGLDTMPADGATIANFVETVWNSYRYDAATGTLTRSFLDNRTGGGGIDTSQVEPGYQLAYGINIAGLSFDGTQAGRGIPDVSALGGGNTFYRVPGADMTGLAGNSGTSASTPLWASLMAQIGAVFADQGLPLPGYANDLIYTAAAVTPAAFNDVRLGNNTSSFVLGGSVTADYTQGSGANAQAASTAITPTGLGYRAGNGYDLATGIGTPNATVLARAMLQVAQAQTFSTAPGVSDADGTAAAGGTLLVQTHLAGSGTVSVGGTTEAVGNGNPLAWDDQLAGRAVQSGFDPALVGAFDEAAQGTVGQIGVRAGEALGVAIDGVAANAARASLTSPFGFVDYTDGAGNGVTLARPVAIAQTAGGAADQDAIVRIRDNGVDAHSMIFYHAADLFGRVDGMLPGDPGYASAAFAHAYATTDGATTIATPGNGQQETAVLAGVNAGDILGFELTDGANQFWGFVNQNAGANGIDHLNRLYNYGMNTWGFEDGINGGDHDFNDVVFQLDFTSKAGHGLLVADQPAGHGVMG